MNLTFEEGAAELLDALAPGKKRRSALLARLLYEEVARLGERRKLVKELQGTL
jgi:hypothetical protein